VTKVENPNVRERLLDVAERLFAMNGVAETSVRAITSEAAVNVAAVNYYFDSKDDLFWALIDRRIGPLNEERRAMLAKVTDPHDVEGILAALALPAIRLTCQKPFYARLASRLRYEGEGERWQQYRARQEGIIREFEGALQAALPHLPAEEVRTRLRYVMGAIIHLWAQATNPDGEPPERREASFIAFFAAALRAPAP